MSRVGGRQVAQQQCRWQQPAGWQHAKARELPTSDNTPAPSAIALRSPASLSGAPTLNDIHQIIHSTADALVLES